MRVLTGDAWKDGFLDYHRAPGQYRVAVRLYAALEPVRDVYFAPTADLRRVINYVQHIGVRQVWRKIRSRWSERVRNEKFLAIGAGIIVEHDADALLEQGQLVWFIAPCHPQCVERIVLPSPLVRAISNAEMVRSITSLENLVCCQARHFAQPLLKQFLHLAEPMAGWNPLSGHTLNQNALLESFSLLEKLVTQIDLKHGQPLVGEPTEIRECINTVVPPQEKTKRHAVVFGYGQYAKINILPNLTAIEVAKVHEIDPCQLGQAKQLPFNTDTSPVLRLNERYEVHCIAGFHHTHAPLAVLALQQGSSAIVEKPIVTNEAQLEALLTAMQHGSGQLFSGFPRRYTPFNDYARADLGVARGEAVCYHCIVYEVKLPGLHWYRWPNSGSRLVSNGCHWIDHFLFLNDFSQPVFHDVWEAGRGEITCVAELANGASFSMTLTDHGSARLGMQEYVELRANDVTIHLRNGSDYTAENSQGIVRKARINKTTVFAHMYRSISAQIANDQPGDSWESVQCSCSLMLQMEETLQTKRVASRQGRTSGPTKE